MLNNFKTRGRASFVLGGQWGSEGKGAAAASIAVQLAERGEAFDLITTNAGAQAGHTSTHGGVTRVVFHLPTAALIQQDYRRDALRSAAPLMVYLNAGSIIDPVVLIRELETSNLDFERFFIHPNAAIITDECREAEGRADSAQTKIASTRKGVGEALSRKVLRSGMLAKDYLPLQRFIKRVDLNDYLQRGLSVLVEVPQGVGLSLDGPFYPHCTSRNCTVMQAMSDAGIHPSYYGSSMLVLRTFPIRVGNIEGFDPVQGKVTGLLGQSGGHYDDQRETSWEELGQKAEITTVTKRVRRVFTFSVKQMAEAMALTRPDVVYLTFCDYLKTREEVFNIGLKIGQVADELHMPQPQLLFQYGPTTGDLYESVQ